MINKYSIDCGEWEVLASSLINEFRDLLNFGDSELGRLLGVHRSLVYRWRTGQRRMSQTAYNKLIEYTLDGDGFVRGRKKRGPNKKPLNWNMNKIKNQENEK
jgi:hypothetical protein